MSGSYLLGAAMQRSAAWPALSCSARGPPHAASAQAPTPRWHGVLLQERASRPPAAGLRRLAADSNEEWNGVPLNCHRAGPRQYTVPCLAEPRSTTSAARQPHARMMSNQCSGPTMRGIPLPNCQLVRRPPNGHMALGRDKCTRMTPPPAPNRRQRTRAAPTTMLGTAPPRLHGNAHTAGLAQKGKHHAWAHVHVGCTAAAAAHAPCLQTGPGYRRPLVIR